MSDPVVNEEPALGLIKMMAASGDATYPFTMRKDPSTNMLVGSEPKKIPQSQCVTERLWKRNHPVCTCKLGGVT